MTVHENHQLFPALMMSKKLVMHNAGAEGVRGTPCVADVSVVDGQGRLEGLELSKEAGHKLQR